SVGLRVTLVWAKAHTTNVGNLSPCHVMQRILFVTGKLAEPSLRRLLAEFAPRAGFAYDVVVLPITVAALATVSWIARHLELTEAYDRIVLPGLCPGDLVEMGGLPVERGPKDLSDLPDYFG